MHKQPAGHAPAKSKHFFSGASSFWMDLIHKHTSSRKILEKFAGRFYMNYGLLQRSLKLLQEAKVVLEIVAEVAYLPLEHRDTLHAHTEGETAVLLAVDS